MALLPRQRVVAHHARLRAAAGLSTKSFATESTGENEKDDIWVIKTGDSSTTHIEDFVPFEFLVILPQVERFEWAL